jgi:hypothetical protein
LAPREIDRRKLDLEKVELQVGPQERLVHESALSSASLGLYDERPWRSFCNPM